MSKKKLLEGMTLSELKNEFWPIFSKYIRTKGCLETRGGDTISLERKDGSYEDVLLGNCVTCDRPYPITKLQAGHFIPGRHPSVIYDERNCHQQCYGCNVMKKGNMVEYFIRMEKRYGREVIDELYEMDKQDRQYKCCDIIELIATYTDKLAKLEANHDELGIWG